MIRLSLGELRCFRVSPGSPSTMDDLGLVSQFLGHLWALLFGLLSMIICWFFRNHVVIIKFIIVYILKVVVATFEA